MDELVKLLTSKLNMAEDQAKEVANTVMSFFKEKLPAVGDQLEALMGNVGQAAEGAVDTAKDVAGDAKEKLSTLAGGLAGKGEQAAGQAGEVAGDLQHKAGDALEAAKDAAEQAVKEAGKVVDDLVGKASDALSGLLGGKKDDPK